jgi:hypothetical protein
MSTELPQHIRDYLAQPHWLYVDSFADGSLKVGTVAESRLDTRLAEQGALAARYVARASDGVAVRRAEEIVSHHFQLTQTVSSKRKLKALGSRVSIDEVTADLEALTEKVRVFMGGARGEIDDVEVMDVPLPWSLPACARLAFTLAPIEQYQGKLVDGDHSIFLKAMTGSIAVFVSDEAPSAELFSVSLAPLYGMQLRLGDYWSSPSPMQSSLL